MRICTLNVNGFRGAGKQPGDHVSNHKLEENLSSFVDLLDAIVVDEQSILIVQEFPHMKIVKKGDKSDKFDHWEADSLHYKALDAIIRAKYRAVLPSHLINSEQCTVGICKETSPWKPIDVKDEMFQYSDSKHSYGNKVVELQNGDITLLGIHMNNNMWNMLLESIREDNSRRYTFLAGDFNADENKGDMRDKPQKIRNAVYRPFVDSSDITFKPADTSIDNIYVRDDYDIGKYSSIVKETEVLKKPDVFQTAPGFKTDHMLCAIEFAQDDVRPRVKR